MKKSLRYRLVLFGVALLMVVQCLPVSAVGEWAPINIFQKKCGHSSGCTVCTYQIILQNSGLLKPEWQLTSSVTSRTTEYANFDKETIKNGLADSTHTDRVYYGALPKVAKAMCQDGVEWRYATDVTGVSGAIENTGLGEAILVGKVGDKRIDKMSDEEVISLMKAFYNCEFYAVLGIYYVGHEEANNGTGSYTANHWVMFTGVDDSGIYINDPIYGSKRMQDCKSYDGQYRIRYLIPIKNNKNSPRSLAGGGGVQITDKDKENLGGVGLPPGAAQGAGSVGASTNLTFNDMSLLSYCSLSEVNLEETLLINANIENLEQDDLEVLEGWKTNLEAEKREWGFIAVLRWITSLVGILLTLWALLVYLAFWLDHINSFFYLDFLHLLTFGALHICPPGEKPTFRAGKDVKNRTVSHAQILSICITAILFGALLISGVFYQLVAKLVHFVTGFVWGS